MLLTRVCGPGCATVFECQGVCAHVWEVCTHMGGTPVCVHTCMCMTVHLCVGIRVCIQVIVRALF